MLQAVVHALSTHDKTKIDRDVILEFCNAKSFHRCSRKKRSVVEDKVSLGNAGIDRTLPIVGVVGLAEAEFTDGKNIE